MLNTISVTVKYESGETICRFNNVKFDNADLEVFEEKLISLIEELEEGNKD